jgi:hypothetical protein
MNAPRLAVTIFAALLAMLTLAWVSFAWGECAWVMWEVYGTRQDPRVPNIVNYSDAKWSVADTFPTYEACRTVMLGQLRHEAIRNEGRTDVWVYKCLPDTVDPRGPKGK